MLADIMVSRAQIGKTEIDLHKYAVADCRFRRAVQAVKHLFGF